MLDFLAFVLYTIIITEYEPAVRCFVAAFNREERNWETELLHCPRNRKNALLLFTV